MIDLKALIRDRGIGDRAIRIREHLHRNPELSEREFRTMELICRRLEELGIPCEKGIADTGVTGLITGGSDGPAIGLRADIDALPIQEENENLPYRSAVPGVMHACGHDAHTAILLGVAETLMSVREQLRGSVRLFFQPAEESIGGARRMIEAGCLENPRVDCVLGLHVDGSLPVGRIGLCYGKMYAASDMLTLKIHGKACHGAHPANGVDAIYIAAAIVTTVQSVCSRNIEATDSMVCTFGTVRGGNVRNQIADYVELTGIIRTLDPATRLFARERVRTICEQTAAMLGGSAELLVEPSYPSLINDDGMTDRVRKNAGELLGAENVVIDNVPSLGTEDFAYFAAARPACFFHLGCALPEERHNVAHSPYFDLDPRCIPLGIELQSANVLSLLTVS